MEDYMKKAATAFLVGRPYGMRVERYGDFTDVFFYSTRTDPYMGIAPDFSKLKAYNRYMYALSLVPGREL